MTRRSSSGGLLSPEVELTGEKNTVVQCLLQSRPNLEYFTNIRIWLLRRSTRSKVWRRAGRLLSFEKGQSASYDTDESLKSRRDNDLRSLDAQHTSGCRTDSSSHGKHFICTIEIYKRILGKKMEINMLELY